MKVQQNISLKNYNTFGIDAVASKFVIINTIEELTAVISANSSFFILGGGSNVLFTKELIPYVIQINLRGIDIVLTNTNEVEIKVAAGENWHQFVMWCIEQNFGGLENLALIPGNVGACPIQNIGAYGVEVKDNIVCVETIELSTLEKHIFKNDECNFNYRDSVFKNHLKGKHIITAVTFKLTTQNHQLKLDYGAITEELKRNNIVNPSIKDVAKTVISIRESKLPDPKIIGNGGSFFKNPVISLDHFKKLKTKYPHIPSYNVSETMIKIPAGWLIEEAGLKGYKIGDAGVHKNQALVLVNYGNSTGKELINLAKFVQNTIKENFQIELEIEVNIL